jgi:hypothetical protein
MRIRVSLQFDVYLKFVQRTLLLLKDPEGQSLVHVVKNALTGVIMLETYQHY